MRGQVRGEVGVADHAAARNRFVERALAAQPLRKRALRPALALVAVFAMALAASVIFLVRREQPALSFAIEPGHMRGEPGAFYASVGHDPLALRFSDGSRVDITPGTRARVAATTPRGASVLVESGQLRAEIVHRPGADWSVSAGPYVVRVTGTSFDVAWNPDGELVIQMRSGAVLVHGPGAEAGVLVRDQQRFVGRAHAEVATPERAPEPLSPPARELRARTATASPTPPSTAASAAPETRPAEKATESWSALVAGGRYADVVQQAERAGFESTLATADIADLAALADAARFSGRASLAERALSSLRSRFASAPAARSAAYLLGRMADDAGNARGAIEWYDRYLAEAPSGSLAPEALGRRMLALRRLGELASSKRAADDYLRRFPEGTYNGVAREMVAP
jgi:hypothetical protein